MFTKTNKIDLHMLAKIARLELAELWHCDNGIITRWGFFNIEENGSVTHYLPAHPHSFNDDEPGKIEEMTRTELEEFLTGKSFSQFEGSYENGWYYRY